MPEQEQKRRKGPGGGEGSSLGSGQTVKVRMGALPGGNINDHEFEPGTTLAEALKQAGLADRAAQAEVRVNNKIEKDMTRKLVIGDQIFIFGKVRGN